MENKSKEFNRWIIVIAGLTIQFCLGAVYAWSVFSKPIESLQGWTTVQVSWAYTINLAMIPVMMIFGGQLMPKIGPKKVAILGGTVVLIGMFLASVAQSLWLLYLGYGFLGGGGIGICYGVPLGTLVKWFPDKRGMITGLAVAGLGFGSLFFTQVAFRLMELYGPMMTIRLVGIIIFVGVFVAAQFLRVAPDGYTPKGWTPPKVEDGDKSVENNNFTPREMLRTPQYYYLFVMYVFACLPGLMIIGHASPIGQKVAGLTPVEASAIVSMLGLLNSFGRLFWGTISDKLGRFKTVLLMFVINAAALFAMNFMSTFLLYGISVGAVAFCFGGAMGTYPALVADVYGAKFVSVNYGLVFLAYSVGAIVGPQLAAYVTQITGGEYYLAFIITGVLCALGGVMVLFFKSPKVTVKENV